MLKVKKLAKIIASTALASAAPYTINQSAIAQNSSHSDIRINYVRVEETLAADAINGYLEVPDTNTTVSAFGGRMRLYDVHLARMIALSHHFHCKESYQGNIEKVMSWEYRANGGKINMGTFQLSCSLVEQAVAAYGLGDSVPTKILFGDGSVKTVRVRILDIEGEAETNDFLKFVQTIKPQR